MRTCPVCSKELNCEWPFNRRKYCSMKCRRRNNYIENREVICAEKSRVYKLDPERVLAIGRASRLRNLDRRKASVNAWKKRNRAKCAENFKRWKKLNPERYKALKKNSEHRRRARKHNSETNDSAIINKWFRSLRGTISCYWCRNPLRAIQASIDHIVPLASGGPHSLGNLCVSCRECNSRKRAKTLLDWNKQITEPALL